MIGFTLGIFSTDLIFIQAEPNFIFLAPKHNSLL